MIINKVRNVVAGGGLAIFIPVAVAYVIGAQFLPIRVISQFAFANTLLSTILLLWLYRGTAKSAFSERTDIGYMWFALGFTLLCAATVFNVGYGTINYIRHVTIVSSNSYWLAGVRAIYVLAFWAFIVAKMTRPEEPRVPPRGWGTIVTIIVGALIMTGGIIWWRGEI